MEKNMQLTDLQKTYCLGMHPASFLGGKYPFLYVSTKISQFEKERFDRSLDAVVRNNTLLHCQLHTETEWVEAEAGLLDEKVVAESGAALTEQICQANGVDPKDCTIHVRIHEHPDHTAEVHFQISGLLIDGMSWDLFLAQLRDAYNGKPLCQTVDFADYAERLRQEKASASHAQNWAAVKQLYDTFEPDACAMPTKSDPFQPAERHNACVCKEIGSSLYQELAAFAKTLQTTPFLLLLTLFSKVIARYSGAQNFFLNVPCSARFRDMEGMENSVGLFSNYLYFPVAIEPEADVETLVQRNAATMSVVQKARFLSGSETVQLTKPEQVNYSRNIIFTMLPFGDDQPGADFIKTNWRIHTNQALLETHILLLHGVPSISINYPKELFDAGVVEELAEMFLLAIRDTLKSKGKNRTLALPQKTQAIIEAVNNNQKPLIESTINDVLLYAFSQYADRTACIYKGQSYSYAEVYRRSSILGELLQKETGTVAIFLPKSLGQFVSAYATLLSGRAYMPLDIELSTSGIAHCLQQTDSRTIITCAALQQKLPDCSNQTVLVLEEIDWNAVPHFTPHQTDSRDVHILINTSGTTGYPKSVMLRDQGLINCLEYTHRIFDFQEGDKLFAITNFCHDMAIFDTIGYFFFGGCAVIPDEQQAMDPGAWISLMQENQIAIWQSVPSFMEMLMLHLRANQIPATDLSLKRVLHGGETLKAGVAEFLYQTFPNVTVYNVGGPSETTIWNIQHRVTEADLQNDCIPYGASLPNTQYHILDQNLEECPIGVSGTMYVTGIGLAAGYKGNPEETAKRFIEWNGMRCYNTGDMGSRLPNGELLFLGRTDFQVKIHGKRIELSGIECILEQQEDLYHAAVVYLPEQELLAAVYVAKREIPASELYAYLKTELPEYMIPKTFVRVDQMPLTHNGKHDRTKLAEIILQHVQEETPAPAVERTDCSAERLAILELFEDELDCEIPDESVNFYEMGGNSLSAVKLSAKLKRVLGKEVSVFQIISSATLKDCIDAML